jgi:predicted metal-binding membrane protein
MRSGDGPLVLVDLATHADGGGGFLVEAAAFVSVWAVMMVAMMLPPFVPALLGYRRPS